MAMTEQLSFGGMTQPARSLGVARSLGIWDAPAPAQVHSEPSRSAAVKIEPLAKSLRAAVLGFIRARADVGATDDEIQRGLGMEGSTQRPRRVELVRAGLVREAAAKRQTKAGRSATVWVAVEVARG
jgi:hypothetical protein